MPKSRPVGDRNRPGGRRRPGQPRTVVLASLPALAAVVMTAACTTGFTGAADVHDRPRFAHQESGDRVVVATTFTILADMTRRVGGDRVRVESVTTPGADVHQYEPSVDDLKRVEGADLVVSNGLGMDDWLLRFLDGTDARHVVGSERVDPMPVRSGNYTGRPNPHAWMSPHEGIGYVLTIADALAEVDPDGTEEYLARAGDYVADLEDMATRARAAVAAVPEERRVLATCEGAFSYLARDLGLEELYLWPVNSESQGLPRQVTSLIDEVRAREIPALFCESTVSDAAMEQVAQETGSRVAGVLYVDSLSAPSGPVPTYLDLLDHDLEIITRELTS
ncbi:MULTISPECIES: metal ABC transporter solute-binding protein, Zn/Mn family [unclassified Dietzia]|uniref:metal ABC transporter solute-binding protein, Zn/Mn family n=1 Tax=unclassified Dietzia TaxID=2617939 RepID=UPI000D204781|nr:MULTISPECIES: zinc ABC transporter substrate-binding protein [unclassified Dietzia]AVZ38816.1 metal ABC transporter substrate-binding protein [Dietzia sp. JS16-p6b]QGW23927.1 ABC-type metal ion transport system, periplasmic component/surface adhesin [Dietzia sp. DQ12-45-1b]